jgi:hypothetical protein
MVSIPVVRPTLKIDVFKMEQAFQMGYWQSNKVFYVFPKNWQGEEAFVANHIHEWDDHWKVVNASFEEGLNTDEDLQRFNGRMSYVWDNNHRLQSLDALYLYSSPRWPFLAHCNGFHHVGYKKGPCPPPHCNDKHEQIRFKLNIMNFKVSNFSCY